MEPRRRRHCRAAQVEVTGAADRILARQRQYSPGSELFVVYSEDGDTDPLMPDRFSELRNRGFVVKMTRLFRF